MISQDTSAYGVDLKYATGFWGGKPVKARFDDLARALGSLGAWVRLHYVYPYPHVDEVIPLMADGKVLPYLDVPFQHGSPRVLKLMKRPAHAENTLERIARWREICPGDHDAQHVHRRLSRARPSRSSQLLLDWLQEAQLDRVGCFEYSPVEGAAANALPDPVPDEVKQERWERFMAVVAVDQRAEARGESRPAHAACSSTRSTSDGAIARSTRGRARDRRHRAHRVGRASSSPVTGPREDHCCRRLRPAGESRVRAATLNRR